MKRTKSKSSAQVRVLTILLLSLSAAGQLLSQEAGETQSTSPVSVVSVPSAANSAGTASVTPLDAFIGTYSPYAGARNSVTVAIDDGHLVAGPSGGGVFELIRDEDARFHFSQAPQALVFVAGADGKYHSFELKQGDSSRTMTRTEVLEARYLEQAGKLRPHALSDAILMADLESAKSLIAAGADVDELDTREEIAGSNGRRPLNWAALNDDASMLQLLLDSGAGIDLTNGSGFTALHHASEAGSTEAAKLLILAGADLDQRFDRGQTAIEVALRSGAASVVQAIQKALDQRCGPEGCPAENLESSSGYQVPEQLDDGIPTSALSAVSTKPDSVYRLLADIEGGLYGKVNSLLILKNGHLVVEKYFNGWSAQRTHQMQSVSKSITSLLVGSAIAQGHIESVDDPIGKYLPNHRALLTGGRELITVRHLLTMSAGFDWNEGATSYNDPDNIRQREGRSKDSVAFTLSTDFVNEPGTVFTYSGGYVTVVGEILKNATETESVLDYFNQSTLADMELGEIGWMKQWDGRQNTAGGVLMRPRDLAKIGQMVLDGGTWKGKRILPEQWIKGSLAPHIATPGSWNEYGYFWWGRTFETEKAKYPTDAAQGWGGQELIIVDALDLVVVMTAMNFESAAPTESLMTISILPAFE